MQKQVVIFSLSLAAVSTGVACWLALRGPTAPASAPQPVQSAKAAPGKFPPLSTAPAPAGEQRKTLTASDFTWNRESVGIGGLTREDVKTGESLPAERPAHVSGLPPAELARRVAQIEKETNHEMRRLVGLLNLSEEQQDGIYEKLAASSRHWVPGMAIAAGGGAITVPENGTAATATDASEDIMALLSTDQQDTLMQAEMDRAAWWAEIITQLDAQADVPALDGTPAVTPSTDTPAYEGSSILE